MFSVSGRGEVLRGSEVLLSFVVSGKFFLVLGFVLFVFWVGG